MFQNEAKAAARAVHLAVHSDFPLSCTLPEATIQDIACFLNAFFFLEVNQLC